MSKYITLTRFRELGITVAQLSDAGALDLIMKVSADLDRLTGQFFAPSLEIHAHSGDGSRLANHRDLVPILEVSNLQVDVSKNRSNYFEGADRVFGRNYNSQNQYDLSRFQISPDTNYRLLSLLLGEFPLGVGNVLMTGAFGYLDNRKAFKTTLKTELALAATTIQIDEASNATGWVDVGDFVLIEIQAATQGIPALVYVDIVKSISGTDLTVDAVQAQAGLPVAVGATVLSFGKFPVALVDVMNALILRAWDADPRNTSGSGGTDDRVTSERVDNYSYQLESKSVVASRAGGYGLITGSVMLDKVLQGYCRPQYVGFV